MFISFSSFLSARDHDSGLAHAGGYFYQWAAFLALVLFTLGTLIILIRRVVPFSFWLGMWFIGRTLAKHVCNLGLWVRIQFPYLIVSSWFIFSSYNLNTVIVFFLVTFIWFWMLLLLLSSSSSLSSQGVTLAGQNTSILLPQAL